MGAGITCKGNMLFVEGQNKLKGATLTAKELRGGAALVLAGSAAEGMSIVENRKYIERGYENICQDLAALGVECKAIN